MALSVLIIGVVIAAGYDALTKVAVILLGAGVGMLGSTVNAFSIVIASDAAGVPFNDRLILHFAILGLTFTATLTYVMRYASCVKAAPSRSLVFERTAENEAQFRGTGEAKTGFTRLDKTVLMLFGATFANMI